MATFFEWDPAIKTGAEQLVANEEVMALLEALCAGLAEQQLLEMRSYIVHGDDRQAARREAAASALDELPNEIRSLADQCRRARAQRQKEG